MFAEMTKSYYVIICLREFLYTCKEEQTRLNDWVVIGVIGGLGIDRTIADNLQKIGT